MASKLVGLNFFSLGHLDIRVIPIGLSVSGTYGCVDGEKGGEGVWSLGEDWVEDGGEYVRGVGWRCRVSHEECVNWTDGVITSTNVFGFRPRPSHHHHLLSHHPKNL